MNKRAGFRAAARAFALAVGVCGLYGSGSFPFAAAQSSKEPAVTLPSVRHGDDNFPKMNRKSVVLVISAQGDFYIGAEKVAKEKLPERLRDLLAGKPPEQQRVFIKADASLKYANVREVLNIVRERGYDDVEFVVQNPRQSMPDVFVAKIYSRPVGVKADPADVLPPIPPRREPTPGNVPPPPPPVPRERAPVSAIQPPPPHMAGVVVEVNRAGSGPDREVSVNTQKMSLSQFSLALKGLYYDLDVDHPNVFILPRGR